jgi:hypothetical protein
VQFGVFGLLIGRQDGVEGRLSGCLRRYLLLGQAADLRGGRHNARGGIRGDGRRQPGLRGLQRRPECGQRGLPGGKYCRRLRLLGGRQIEKRRQMRDLVGDDLGDGRRCRGGGVVWPSRYDASSSAQPVVLNVSLSIRE